jgi:4-hydroxybenzoate polyprenyltransferase
VGPWLKAARPHQWSKNLLVLAPVALGWSQMSAPRLVDALCALLLLCAASSLSYMLNDVIDVEADRLHLTKRRRPFASGHLARRHGVALVVVGLPVVLLLGWLISPAVAASLAAYCALTLAYSFWLKRIAVTDAFVIGALFTMRLVIGTTAAALEWSAWLLTFSVFFFSSLALAKRHTELVGAGPDATGPVPGRGYRYEDRSLTLVLGVAASTASVLIGVEYLMAEVFPRGAYAHPLWLWAAPPLIFLWIGRIWLLANRGEMHDDPVVFALTDPVSHGLGAGMVIAFLLALL